MLPSVPDVNFSPGLSSGCCTEIVAAIGSFQSVMARGMSSSKLAPLADSSSMRLP